MLRKLVVKQVPDDATPLTEGILGFSTDFFLSGLFETGNKILICECFIRGNFGYSMVCF